MEHNSENGPHFLHPVFSLSAMNEEVMKGMAWTTRECNIQIPEMFSTRQRTDVSEMVDMMMVSVTCQTGGGGVREVIVRMRSATPLPPKHMNEAALFVAVQSHKELDRRGARMLLRFCCACESGYEET